MRTVALLLILPACVSAQLKLSPQDESDIRAAIDEQAKKDNQRAGDQLWTERGPVVYHVRHLEQLAPNVALADADGTRTGSFPDGPRPYVFFLTRIHGRWNVVKEIAVCPPGGIKLISVWPQCALRTSPPRNAQS
jgi:hypothetical protein